MWAIVGSYAEGDVPGGLTVFRLDPATGAMQAVARGDRDIQAGYLVHSPRTGTVYCVDERKTDGRGPVGQPAAIHAFGFDAATGALIWKDRCPVFGPFPTFLDFDEARGLLLSASHGSFDHVEQVRRTARGWEVEYLYDHSTVALYRLKADGSFDGIADLHVLDGHGPDPNTSPQAGGHAQASAHAHCATLDPSRRFVLVCDKGTDSLRIYRLTDRLEPVAHVPFPPQTAPRHVAFAPDGRRFWMVLELSSELASLDFDPDTGAVRLLDRVRTTGASYSGPNEPAELRLSPDGRHLYVNNRGEDSLAWFSIAPGGALKRQGAVMVAKSIHPRLAARSFAFASPGLILFADRPAGLVRSFAVDTDSGALSEIATTAVPGPAFVAIIPERPGP
ncbi:3-carboxymuconate cyclase [Rubellimicrobium thermophilum DSM 16684]|uniref:3-carboxymuconate cyclase n=1 Tax=Rubellimicrobium thermophilum DSM 16684 TaxID=1123069 RepID=S9R187_9RHOB|nr:beta-propeller fold lactonase family protein [Rubellimicrobium thermophilum]EPX87441.1 3-carboxymuconate cyclase [Rubellimicrobium thermophilum DSM 16684]